MKMESLLARSIESALDRLGVGRVSNDLGAFGTIGIFTCGALVGAAFGLLFAPKPGSELRGWLERNFETARERANEVTQGPPS